MSEKVITVRMSAEMHTELKAYCISTSRSMNGEITALIQAKLSMVEPKDRALLPPPPPQPVGGLRDQSQNERGAD